MSDNKQPKNTGGNELVVRYRNVINRSTFPFSLVEMRVLQTAIAKLVKNPPRNRESVMYHISAAELASFGGDAKSSYAQLKQAAKELMSRTIVFNDIDKEDLSLLNIKAASGTGVKQLSGQLEFPWFSVANYDVKNGRIGLVFNPQLIPCFDQLTEQFTRYQLSDLQGLTSTYPIRLYGMLMQFYDTGVLDISVQELRDRLLSEDVLRSYGDFKRRVISFSVEQINQAPNSKIHVDFEEKRVGRRVERIVFRFTRSTPSGPHQELLDLETDPSVIDMKAVTPYAAPANLNYKLTAKQRETFADWLSGRNAQKKKEIDYDPSKFISYLYSKNLCEAGTFSNCSPKEITDKLCRLLTAPSFVEAVYAQWLVPFGVRLKTTRARR